MIRNLILSLAFMGVASVATAHEIGRVTTVQVSYRTEIIRDVVPGPCYVERVPIYRGGNPVSGAIIGGLIGNQFGNGSGKDAATALGAIIGSEITNRREIVGWKEKRRCEDRVSEQHLMVKDGYRVFYSVRGHTYSFHTYERFSVGDRIIHRY